MYNVLYYTFVEELIYCSFIVSAAYDQIMVQTKRVQIYIQFQIVWDCLTLRLFDIWSIQGILHSILFTKFTEYLMNPIRKYFLGGWLISYIFWIIREPYYTCSSTQMWWIKSNKVKFHWNQHFFFKNQFGHWKNEHFSITKDQWGL